MQVTVNPGGLAPGSYYGLLRVDYAGDNPKEAANSPQVLTVVLEVPAARSNPPPLIQPAELTFTGVEGGEFPGSKEISSITLRNINTFQSVISTGQTTSRSIVGRT